jgi:hypothetical protein
MGKILPFLNKIHSFKLQTKAENNDFYVQLLTLFKSDNDIDKVV